MIVLSRKRIGIILTSIFIAVFAFSFNTADISDQNVETKENREIVQTATTPVSGKVVVLDAGHGVPDEGIFWLTL